MFYVYVYRDPRATKDRQVVYVGKGVGGRDSKHWKYGNKVNPIFDAWLKAIRRAGLEPIIERVLEDVSEQEAFVEERRLIALFGRKDKGLGTLCNCTDGGEGPAGLVMSPEAKQKQSKSAKNRKSQVHKSPDFRGKISGLSEKQWADPEYRGRTVAAMVASHKTPEAFAKKSAAVAAGWQDESTRAKRIAGIKASRTPELRAQIGASCAALWDERKKAEQSAKMKAVYATPEAKAAKSAAMKLMWEKRKAAKGLTPSETQSIKQALTPN